LRNDQRFWKPGGTFLRRKVRRKSLPPTKARDSQRTAWRRTIEAFDEAGQDARQIALFPEDPAAPALN
jgi:hypothetical protein